MVGVSAARVAATAAPKECPTSTSIVLVPTSARTATAASAGVNGFCAEGLAPWLGRSNASTVQPRSASSDATCHQVFDDEVDPWSSTAVRGPAPQRRRRSGSPVKGL